MRMICDADKTVVVCKKAFCSFHDIKVAWLKRKVRNLEVDIKDLRSKHAHHHKLNDAIRQRVRKHIASFPARESHDSVSKQTTRNHLDASLNITEMQRQSGS
ncbi:unnamed protein product [Lepeophtheirus salmonis]|uniref:(salmon louse) hypothetical protein n=1 Tax=Lepeophtheirus salmonis TaxID=72036 RepID=A0A7R8CE94_LEPSM|nr:unnamed protein product [Lepeophtheirus salmonis]CAF2783242.1 unnamed protein product [Lepeophtheirus salmonis]